ncbi:sensor histidine kinase [Heyndrickxia sp. NPDC080065]|uniref:sensor histidine kinase n=1 Tax=Heyndrickxia sp. NPDC080065 TaxID=3390568 RepID=UPI003CFF645B
MFKKIYPNDQVEKYLLIDVIAIVFFIYHILNSSGEFNVFEKLILIFLFLISFYISLWNRDWRLLVACLTGYTVLMILSVSLNQWILLYGFMFADLLGRARRKLYIGIGTVGIALIYTLFSWINDGTLFTFGQFILFPFIIIQLLIPIVIYTKREAKNLRGKLDSANAQLERYIQEEERHRIARDLHDTLGQTLTMIKLKSELTMKLIDKNSKQAKQELNDILNTSRFALKQVRELVADMKFISLEKELEQTRTFLQTAGIKLDINMNDNIPSLSNIAETMLALSLREAITNIIKHSQASYCSIHLYIQKDIYYMQISDNGNGNIIMGKGNGIQSIKERIKLLEGDVHISSSLNSGVTILLKVPLSANEREKFK